MFYFGIEKLVTFVNFNLINSENGQTSHGLFSGITLLLKSGSIYFYITKECRELNLMKDLLLIEEQTNQQC